MNFLNGLIWYISALLLALLLMLVTADFNLPEISHDSPQQIEHRNESNNDHG